MLLANQQIPLTTDASCKDIGTQPSDKTLGDYLSGFLASQDRGSGGNWIEATGSPDQAADGSRVWKSHVVLHHAAGEDVWGWGVSYTMKGTDHTIIPGSIQCTGAG